MDTILALCYTGTYCDSVTSGYPLGNGYRTYVPDLMRFTAPDDLSPFGAGGVNPYIYCAGDPVNQADPSGHFISTFFPEGLRAAQMLILGGKEANAMIESEAIREGAIARAHAVRAVAESSGQAKTMDGFGLPAKIRDEMSMQEQSNFGIADNNRSVAPKASNSANASPGSLTSGLGNRAVLDHRLAELTAGQEVNIGSYPNSVRLVNQVLGARSFNISERFQQLVEGNIARILDGERTHAAASLLEVRHLAADAVNPSIALGSATRVANLFGVLLNIIAASVHAQEDIALYTARSFDGAARVELINFVAHDPIM